MCDRRKASRALMEGRDKYHRVSGLQQQGQTLYREKQYLDALLIFSKLIEADTRLPASLAISILDNRAATYIKLNNNQAALNDGRQMIQREKTNSTGYLRTCKTLQLIGNHKMALDLYELGIRKVPLSDPNVQLLRTLHKKLFQQLATPKSVDPLKVLPREIGMMVMELLDFQQRVGLLRVSKGWNDFLCLTPSLWSNLDFSRSKKSVNLQAVRKYIKLAKGTVTRTTLHGHGNKLENVPRYIATRCKNLQEIIVPAGLLTASLLEAAPCATNLKTLILSSRCHTTIDTVNQLLGHCPLLERAEFNSVMSSAGLSFMCAMNLQKLRSLILTCRVPPKGVQEGRSLKPNGFFWNIPHIASLSIRGWFFHANAVHTPPEPPDFSVLKQLKDLDISGLSSVFAPKLPSSLRSLDMSKCMFNTKGTFAPPSLPELTRLSIAGTSTDVFSEPQGVQHMLLSNSGLTHLDGSGGHLTSDDIKQLVRDGYLDKIEELRLDRCDVDDGIATLLAGKLLNLRVLYFASTKVTGCGIKDLVTGKGKLEYLCVDNCSSVGIDAVEWARSKGVEVAFSFPDPKTGRKIR